MLRAVAGVDVNVFGGEIAGPDARAAVAGMQRDDDGNVLREHFAVRGAFVEGIFAAAAADFYAGERNIRALEIEGDAGAAGGGEDAAPVGIGAGDGGFYQRRIRDGERDLLCGAIRGRAAHFDFDHVVGAFAIGDDLQGEGLADEFERGAEFLPSRHLGSRFWARRMRRWRAARRCRWSKCLHPR